MEKINKSIFLGLFAIALLVSVSFHPFAVRASGEKFAIEQVTGNGTGTARIFFYIDDGVGQSEKQITFPLGPYATETAYRSTYMNAVLTWAQNNGYPGATMDDVYIYSSQPRIFANPTRALNTAFQISSTNDTFVSYSVDIAATLSLTGGQSGTVYLEYADDSGFTTNVVTAASTVNGNTGTLSLGLSITQTATASLSGEIPAGKYVRLRTANTTGSPTFTFRLAQEVTQ